MATCPFCLEQIAENARKCRHCQSFVDHTAHSKNSSDLADFVIKFVGYGVGLLTTFGAIAAIGFAIFGWRSFADLKTEIKADIDRLKTENTRLVEDVRTSLVDSSYERYQRIVDTLILDEISDQLVGELRQIQNRIQNLKTNNVVASEKIKEMDKIIQAIRSYKMQDYEGALRDVSEVTAVTPSKYRMACSVNSKLFVKHSGNPEKGIQGNSQLAEKYLADLYACTQTFLQLSPNNDLAHALRARAYMRQAEKESDPAGKLSKYKEAVTHLLAAERFGSGRSYINYNLAACHTALDEFPEAIEQLRKAKTRGDFSKPSDIDFFRNDKDFVKLRSSARPEIKRGLEELGLNGTSAA